MYSTNIHSFNKHLWNTTGVRAPVQRHFLIKTLPWIENTQNPGMGRAHRSFNDAKNGEDTEHWHGMNTSLSTLPWMENSQNPGMGRALRSFNTAVNGEHMEPWHGTGTSLFHRCREQRTHRTLARDGHFFTLSCTRLCFDIILLEAKCWHHLYFSNEQ